MNKESAAKGQDVLELLENSTDSRELGLVAFEHETYTSSLIELLPDGQAAVFCLRSQYDDRLFAEALVSASREGQWLIVECQTDPAPSVITLLKQLSEEGACSIPHFEDKELFYLKLNPKTRLLVTVSEQILQTITYPYFLNLFGPVIRIGGPHD